MKRRDAIKTLFAAAALGVSGCVQSIEDEPENDTDGTTPDNNGGGENGDEDDNGGNGGNGGNGDENTTENDTNETEPIRDYGVVELSNCTTIKDSGSRKEVVYSIDMMNMDNVTHEGIELDVWFRVNGVWQAGDDTPVNFNLEPKEVQTREIGYTSFDPSSVEKVKHQISVLENENAGDSGISDVKLDC